MWGGDGGVGGVRERFGVFGEAGSRIRVLRVIWLAFVRDCIIFCVNVCGLWYGRDTLSKAAGRRIAVED